MVRKLLLGLAALSAAFMGNADMVEEARVSDLAWMTGSWSGPFGEQMLEENWNRPASGSIACLVRITGDGKTNMMELILIEEVDNTLLFRVRQWLPGFLPRRPEPQIMTLAEIADRRVTFDGTGDSDFKRLTYSRPSQETFQIDVEPRQGEAFQVILHGQKAPE